MLEGISNRWRRWRYGGVTGLNYVNANAKMTSIVALPWLIGYFTCFMFVPDPFLEASITMMSIIWIFYCYGIYAYAKVDATRYRPFPQSQWRFPDGGSRKFDLMVPSGGFSKQCDFEDGFQGWKVKFSKRFQYWDARSDFPFVFDYALWKLPSEPDKCFQFLSEGEFFHRGIAIRHPACEDISVYTQGWIQDHLGRYVPVCAINDCSLKYVQELDAPPTSCQCKYCRSQVLALDKQCSICGAVVEKPTVLKEVDKWKLAYETERGQRMMLERHAETLEDIVETGQKDAVDFRGRVEDEVSKRRSLFKTIVDMGKPLIQRIKANLWKIALVLIGIFFLLWFFGVIKI